MANSTWLEIYCPPTYNCERNSCFEFILYSHGYLPAAYTICLYTIYHIFAHAQDNFARTRTWPKGQARSRRYNRVSCIQIGLVRAREQKSLAYKLNARWDIKKKLWSFIRPDFGIKGLIRLIITIYAIQFCV